MIKKDKKEQTGNFMPVFGVVYNLDEPEQLQKAFEHAVKNHQFAITASKQAARYLNQCKRLVESIQIEITARKEVCHG